MQSAVTPHLIRMDFVFPQVQIFLSFSVSGVFFSIEHFRPFRRDPFKRVRAKEQTEGEERRRKNKYRRRKTFKLEDFFLSRCAMFDGLDSARHCFSPPPYSVAHTQKHCIMPWFLASAAFLFRLQMPKCVAHSEVCSYFLKTLLSRPGAFLTPLRRPSRGTWTPGTRSPCPSPYMPPGSARVSGSAKLANLQNLQNFANF